MKTVVATIVTLLLSITVFPAAINVESRLIEYRSHRMEKEMWQLIQELEEMPQDGKTLAILCEALTEYANWAKISQEEREKIYERAVEVGKKSVELLPESSYANYVTGAAIGRLAQYKGIIQSLFMLGDFDKYILKAIELDPNNYTALVAMGMRYRDTPWPFRDFRKSEQYFLKAIEVEPAYVNSYYELAVLYEQWSEIARKSEDREKYFQKAKQLYEKIILMEPHPQWIAQGEETKQIASNWLKEHD
ncbi:MULTISPECIES: tetratricopeptide repeat protein [Pseudothermotoga]|jgi:tetratricopeptide (TPR) repeat protein|uniref:Uncharacterized protein n=1 Tax=Pseudothermotoga lettingae (strain ATCC BAA-301 / DSM 14385 / NBRC 107922 / TMO) TaxID=416591 RepID=A8F3I7_PSELT|nr:MULTISPECIES: hypothetical protein [Pseudothermotoga]ABV32721.1 hypothetical protein Tlet_0151 [Pseudothermotoga lettingae TMO]KUK20481.1 MAG: Uncharacterized protein XD56_1607 [Pseudothermotoga lettingae]MDI3495517.1 hypothetical protein [Pseudothermotoga sp.]MDK2885272.1 hypothetical protein [Pseudothermotoga sp.]GLI48286.1 hypothetical protein PLETTINGATMO_04550 [Pseudothermotoga lettingae TMO]